MKADINFTKFAQHAGQIRRVAKNIRIVIAIDSFKGSMSSRKVTECLAKAFSAARPDIEVLSFVMADGGEGTVAALLSGKRPDIRDGNTSEGGTLSGSSFRTVTTTVSGPLVRPVSASFAIDGEGVCIMEISAASGLTLLSPEERNPLLTSTAGTGELITKALDEGCRDFIVGLGGSATNDAGTGMLQSLGFRFLDKEGVPLNACGAALEDIASIDGNGSDPRLAGCHFKLACDVRNPFCGPQGAAFVFAPQKGADAATVQRLDSGMKHFADMILEYTGRDIASIPGAGAAGGLGGAFSAFLDAQMLSGAGLVLDSAGFDGLIKDADLVITGEGKLDSQTFSGKAPSTVLERATRRHIPVIAIAGKVEACKELESAGFKAIYATAEENVPDTVAMTEEYTSGRLEAIASSILRSLA